MDNLYVYQKNTILGEKLFSSFSGLSVLRSNAYLDYDHVCSNYCGTYYTYTIQGSYLMRVNTSSFSADDLTLTLPAGCSSATTLRNSSKVCNAIDYLRATLTVAPFAQKTGAANFSSADTMFKRIFYRVANPAIAEYLNDPVITVSGITRPLDMDSAWHYIDIPHTGSGEVSITASNVSDESRGLIVDLFTEHYPIH